MRNLRNSWYHECAFNYPEDRSERLKFAPWQIIQFYYVMYTALSAIVRCFDNRPNLSQRAALRLFTDDIVVNPEPIALPVPLCLYLQTGTIHPTPRSLVSWQYGLDNHIPRVERCLADLPAQNRAVSLFHYFKSLREWANYEDSYIFINLYGSSVIEMLDRSLRNIASAFCTFSEIFVICFFGWDKVHDQFTRFGFHMPGTLNVYPASLFARFEEYEKCAELTA